ncbi:hypothetical protein T484DRAFT_1815559, partial [Baffinella frigidus]
EDDKTTYTFFPGYSQVVEDDEIVLQITYTFFRCLQHESTRDILLNQTQHASTRDILLNQTQEILLNQTQVVSYFVDLLYDKNDAIRKMADQTLDL